jgi:hypothetical protein
MKKAILLASLLLATQQNNTALAATLDDHAATSAPAGARVCPPRPQKGHTQYFAKGRWHFAKRSDDPHHEGEEDSDMGDDTSSAVSTSSEGASESTPRFAMATPPTPKKGFSEAYDRTTNTWHHVRRY